MVQPEHYSNQREHPGLPQELRRDSCLAKARGAVLYAKIGTFHKKAMPNFGLDPVSVVNWYVFWFQKNMAVAAGPDEIPDFQPSLLRHHVGQQRVGGDVEGHAQEDVGAALIKLAGQLAVGHVELEQGVAGRQLHARHVGHVPGRDDHPARVRIVLDLVEHLADLVDVAAVRGPRSRRRCPSGRRCWWNLPGTRSVHG